MPLLRLKNTARLFFVLIGLLGVSRYRAYAQSLGDPVVHITFGSGTAVRGGALAADSGSTTYSYAASGEIGENYYTITNLCNTAIHGSFVTSTDHTGNSGGYMMVVNGNITAGTVFTRTVPGLCGTTTYQFGVWIKNVLSSGGILPNMVFHIYAADGTTELGSGVSTGDVPSGNVWHNYTANFTLPAGTGSVIIKLVSNASGTQGNDFAVDDITFSPYGSTVSAVYHNTTATSQTTCSGTTQSYTVDATSSLASGYVQKLQAYTNGAWIDQSPASTSTSFTFTPPTTAGTYLYRLVSAISDNINSPSCVVASNQLTLVVSPGPTAAIGVADNSCLGTATVFTDQSNANSGTITGWSWDFGDGTTSTAQNPTHIYAATGSYTASLTVANSNGCTSATATKSITINTVPVAAFSISAPDCETRSITFTDASMPGTGAITGRAWDFGDGTTAATQNPSHTYAAAGNYTVSLTVTSSTGCNSMVAKALVIHALPVVAFTLPDVCLSDAAANFTDNSTIADGSALTYLWNFGDANATVANPNASSAKNPSHKYTAAANYTVTLTVTSKDGCTAATLSSPFTVNGDNPIAGFTADASNTYCSSDDVLFTNTASVSFGKITMIKMYWDYNGDKTNVITYTKDQITTTGFKLTHNYGLFNTAGLTKAYGVKMIAYSGSAAGCTGESAVQNIVIKANPVVTIPAIGPLCEEASPVQISENKNGFSGSGVFSGTGVSSTGLFDPLVSGPGTFTINYLFTAANSCGYSASQTVTVYATPVISAGKDTSLLEGGRIRLAATAAGDGPLTYKWTLANGSPATGLDHDDVLQPVASPADDISYMLRVTSAHGCTASSTINLKVLKAPVVPNTFTPNGDGVNDTWNIKYLDTYPDCTVQIFNRYGYQLYYSLGYPTAWNGSYNGQPLPVGTYYYIINPKSGRDPITGSLTIIR